MVQYAFGIGATDITDLLTNTAGGLIGLGISFFISVAPNSELGPFIDRAEARHGQVSGMRELLGGLREAASGSTPDRQFLGWVTGRHGVLDALGVPRQSA